MQLAQLAAQGWSPVVDSSGNARPALAFTLTTADGTAVPIYSDAAGTTALVTADLITGARGTVPGYAYPGRYTFTVDGTTETVIVADAPVNVLTYGADPTGVADSTAAFGRAKAAGKRIYVPEGTYKASLAALTTDGYLVEGDGFRRTVLKPTLSSGYCVDLQTSGFHAVRGITIDGTNCTGTAGALRMGGAVNDCDIDVEIRNFTATTVPAFAGEGPQASRIKLRCDTNWKHGLVSEGTANAVTYQPAGLDLDLYLAGAQATTGYGFEVRNPDGVRVTRLVMQRNLTPNGLGLTKTTTTQEWGRGVTVVSPYTEDNGGTSYPATGGNGRSGSHGIHVEGADSTHLLRAVTIIASRHFSSQHNWPNSQIYVKNAHVHLSGRPFSNLGTPNKAVELGADGSFSLDGGHDFAGTLDTLAWAPTYGASVAIDLARGPRYKIGVANNNNFTIANPTPTGTGGEVTIDVTNASGGAMGTITWDTLYVLNSAWSNPAAGAHKVITFMWEGDFWVEKGRA